MKRTEKRGAFDIVIERREDEAPDLSYLEQDYSDVEDLTEREKYLQQDRERLEALHSGDWSMMYVLVTVRINNTNNWLVPHEVGRASLSGIESDSEESYFVQVENELIDEALQDAELTYKALAAAFKR